MTRRHILQLDLATIADTIRALPGHSDSVSKTTFYVETLGIFLRRYFIVNEVRELGIKFHETPHYYSTLI